MAIAFLSSVESTGFGSNGGATPSVDTTGATLLIMTVSQFAVGTMSDSEGNSWTELTNIDSAGGSFETQWWYSLSPTTSATHTFSYTGSSTFPVIVAAAYSGDGIVFDKESVADVFGGAAAAGSITPSEDDSLIISFVGHGITQNQTVDESMTERHDRMFVGGVEVGLAYADKIQTTATAINPSWSSPATAWRGASVAAFHILKTTAILTLDVGVVQHQPVDGYLRLRGPLDVDIYKIQAQGKLQLIPKAGSGIQTTEDGNVRGGSSIDLQSVRSNVAMVASGDKSVISGGEDNIASAAYDTVGGGFSNFASGGWSTIAGGSGNNIVALCTYGSILGGQGHTLSATADWSTICGGINNDSTVTAGSIGGGSDNNLTNSSNYATIGGGQDNDIAFGNHSAICGGQLNVINTTANWAFIGGGNSIDLQSSSYGVICGGQSNALASAGWGFVGGGFENGISTSSIVSVIVGGDQNTISTCERGFIGSGDLNKIQATTGGQTSAMSSIVCGLTNNINDSEKCFIGCGENNEIIAQSDWATIGGGQLNSINSAATYATIVGGNSNDVSASYATAMGQESSAELHGEVAQASGHFATAGDMQTSVVTARITTTDATVTSLALDGSSAALTVQDNTMWTFFILVEGLQDTGATGGSYRIEGAVRRDGSGGATLVGTPVQTVIGEDTASWDAVVDVSGNDLRIRVTGAASTNINWGARIEILRVTSAA